MTADADRPYRRRAHKRSPAWAALFFEALATTGVVEQAIEMVGRPSSKRTYYRYKNKSRTFAREWEQALERYRRSVAKDPRVPA